MDSSPFNQKEKSNKIQTAIHIYESNYFSRRLKVNDRDNEKHFRTSVQFTKTFDYPTGSNLLFLLTEHQKLNIKKRQMKKSERKQGDSKKPRKWEQEIGRNDSQTETKGKEGGRE